MPLRISAPFDWEKASRAFRSLDKQTAEAFQSLPAAVPAPKATEADGSLQKAMEAEITFSKIAQRNRPAI